MTNILQNTVAALAAILIVAATWAPVITVPAESPVVFAPAIA